MKTNEEELINSIKELTETLKEIKEWLLSHKIKEQSKPTEQIQSINKNKDREKVQDIIKDFKCPNCNSSMVARFGPVTNSWFAGCIRFPECKGTRNLSGAANPKPERQRSKLLDYIDEPDDVPF